jgi:hypothetical protein
MQHIGVSLREWLGKYEVARYRRREFERGMRERGRREHLARVRAGIRDTPGVL